MGKHNGKARRLGASVGKTLENASRQRRPQERTDTERNEQSVLVQHGVEELVTLAELAGRDFAAERNKLIVLESRRVDTTERGSPSNDGRRRDLIDQVVRIPRRPKWTAEQTTEDIDQQERQSFVEWRRNLAQLNEQMPDMMLTPYEKNLEVWRQLWRVLERSDILAQIVDARSPLLYYSEDVVEYGMAINPEMISLVLLNKADLVSEEERRQWAKYFTLRGIVHAFWSAKPVVQTKEETAKYSATVLSVTEIVELLEGLAVKQRQKSVETENGPQRRSVVGLVGHPNVGKSSTINAIFGQKKTPVAMTPGRTKHFQTLHVGNRLCLCDCPGLVFPAVSKSRAEMVAAGVIPVDGLTDVVSPVGIIIARAGAEHFSRIYGLPSQKLADFDSRRPESAAVAIAALAVARGWMQAAGRPDMTKTGRAIIKDYLSGKLHYCDHPPGVEPLPRVTPQNTTPEDEKRESTDVDEVGESIRVLTEADHQLLQSAIESLPDDDRKPKRAPHKFQKKPPRKKGNRGRQYNQTQPIESDIHVKGKTPWSARQYQAVPQ